MKDRIAQATKSPHELEALYRENPEEFARTFEQAFADRTDSAILQVWRERLFFEGPKASQPSSPPLLRCRPFDIGVAILLSLIAGTMAKIPHIFPSLNDERFYSRNLAGIVAGALIAYFCIQRQRLTKVVGILIAMSAAGLLFLNLLPDNSSSHTLVLSCIHLPFLFWSLVGVAFLGGAWKNLPGRMNFVRYNGELLVYTSIVILGGMVLTGLTLALFNLIDLRIETWYLNNVVVYGAIASPIVATLLIERVVGDRFKIAPLLAKVFTPLFLLTVIAYLLAMIMMQKSPFTDRDFLIAFNGLLLVVLGLCVFSISERGPKESTGINDIMNIGLVSVTLVIDLVALAAILFRMTSYGFSPNRVAVLGANLLAFGHLTGILYHYIRFARKGGTLAAIETWIVGYIPAYTAWSVFVTVAFPLIFRFR